MELSCPKCDTRFTIADEALGPDGRKVRCSVCSHVWHAAPADAPLLLQPDAGAATAPPQPTSARVYADSPPRETAKAADAGDDLPALSGQAIPTWTRPEAAPAPPPAPATRPGRWTGVAIGVALLAAVALTYALRDQIASLLPAAKPIFQLAELPLQRAGDGLEFVNLATGPVTENGQPMLRVTGFIQNTLDIRRPIPWVRIELRDGNDRMVASSVQPPPPPGTIEPQAALRVVFDLPQSNLPAEGLAVALRFTEAPAD